LMLFFFIKTSISLCTIHMMKSLNMSEASFRTLGKKFLK
jgi:hypothetical protein